MWRKNIRTTQSNYESLEIRESTREATIYGVKLNGIDNWLLRRNVRHCSVQQVLCALSSNTGSSNGSCSLQPKCQVRKHRFLSNLRRDGGWNKASRCQGKRSRSGDYLRSACRFFWVRHFLSSLYSTQCKPLPVPDLKTIQPMLFWCSSYRLTYFLGLIMIPILRLETWKIQVWKIRG